MVLSGYPILKRLSEESMQTVVFAEQEMLRTGHSAISPLHLLLGALIHYDNSIAELFAARGITADDLRESAESIMGIASERPPKEIQLTDAAQAVIKSAEELASSSNFKDIQPEHLFVAMLRVNDGHLVKCLKDLDIDIKNAEDIVRKVIDIPRDEQSIEPYDSKKQYSTEISEDSHFDQAKAAEYVEKMRLALDEACHRRGSRNSSKWQDWETSADKFHRALNAAYPPGFSQNFALLTQGQSEALEMAIVFLENDPWFFRSGYVKADLIRYIVRIPLLDDQLQRLRRVVLSAVENRHRREFRSYCRLARKIDNEEFRAAVLVRAQSTDLGIRLRARWIWEVLSGMS